MKYILVGLLVIHGLIHLLGFTKAFDLAQPPQLQAAISRPLGILWLAAAILLGVSAGLVALARRRWWVPAAFGVLVSQVLILTGWNNDTPMWDWREFDGRKLPIKGEAIWTLPGGEFAYGRFKIQEVQYNLMDR